VKPWGVHSAGELGISGGREARGRWRIDAQRGLWISSDRLVAFSWNGVPFAVAAGFLLLAAGAGGDWLEKLRERDAQGALFPAITGFAVSARVG
jgi:hypothetical protein